MPHFWLATFDSDPPFPARPSLAEPFAGGDVTTWAIEVIVDDAGEEMAVLFSTVDNAYSPAQLKCQLGFANGAKTCSVWRDRGFPLVDANITRKEGALIVFAPCFLPESAEMSYREALLSIKGIPPNGAGSPAEAAPAATELAPVYKQKLEVPDSVFPATKIVGTLVDWLAKRKAVVEHRQAQTIFKGESVRFPKLDDFDRKPVMIWSGQVELPEWQPVIAPVRVERGSRRSIFGDAEFRFEDVEVLGFRIDLTKCGTGDDKRIREGLNELLKPLNFHRNLPPDRNGERDESAVSDFRYEPASRTLMLELLRYGKMKLKKGAWPVTEKDFQSQHELLIRILAGRVDDDTAQARDPATFVPAIFVDNPWSKVIARAAQGFDKRLADFCVKDGKGEPKTLRPDGRLAPQEEPWPLASIAQISLTKTAGAPAGQTLLELDCPPLHNDDWDTFDEIDPDLVFGAFPLRWLQTDFTDPEYRRSFARSVLSKKLVEIQSIQVSPIGERKLKRDLREYATWIRGKFNFDGDLRVARPEGSVNLTFHAGKRAPAAWNTLCNVLGIDGLKGTITFPAGSWYRIVCSMDYTLQNGLD
jgi:hypothetical protein